jgi:hypothetical protein
MNLAMSYQRVGFFLSIFIVFFPTYLFGSSASKGQVFLFFLFPVVLLFFLLCKSRHLNDFSIKIPTLGILLLVTLAITILTLLSKSEFVSIGMLINHLRYLAYAVVFIFSYNLAIKMKVKSKTLSDILFNVSFITILFIALQLIVPDFFLVKLLTKKPALDYLGFRIGGPLEWSYVYCFCMMPTIFMGMHQFVRKEGRKWNYFVTILVLFAFLLSQSKAAYISLILFMAIWIVFSIYLYKRNYRLFVGLFIFLILSSGFVYVFWDLFAHVIGFLKNRGVDGSTTNRLHQFEVVRLTLENNLIFGFPTRYIVIENAYMHYLYNYGVLGLTNYIILFGCFFIDACLRLKKIVSNRNGNDVGLYIGMVSFAGSVFIYALGASPTDANKASYFFYFIYGVFIATSKTD